MRACCSVCCRICVAEYVLHSTLAVCQCRHVYMCVLRRVLQNMCCRIHVAQHPCFWPMYVSISVRVAACVAEYVLRNVCCRIRVAEYVSHSTPAFCHWCSHIMVHSRLPIYVYLYICCRMRVAESVAEYTLHSVMHLLGANGALYFGVIWVEYTCMYIYLQKNVCCRLCCRMYVAERVSECVLQTALHLLFANGARHSGVLWFAYICTYVYLL